MTGIISEEREQGTLHRLESGSPVRTIVSAFAHYFGYRGPVHIFKQNRQSIHSDPTFNQFDKHLYRLKSNTEHLKCHDYYLSL
jgi:hypothetical protein